MAETEKIKIEELLKLCVSFVQGKGDPDVLAQIEAIERTFVIRDYIPLAEKELLLRRALIDIRMDDDEGYSFTVGKEIVVLFDLLLPYVTNMEMDINTVFRDYDYYDCLYVCGVPQYIMGFCKEDFNRLTKMLDDTVSYDNIRILLSELTEIDSTTFDELSQSIKNFKTEIKPETMEFLSKIAAFNDPLLHKVKDTVEEAARKEMITD